jgi:hypothetical protein
MAGDERKRDDRVRECGGGDAGGDPQPGFVVSGIPFVYLDDLYRFCREHELSAVISLREDDGRVEDIVFSVSQHGDAHAPEAKTFAVAEELASKLIEVADGEREDLHTLVTSVLASVKLLGSSPVTLTLTTNYAFLRFSVRQLTTGQLARIFDNSLVKRATIFPGMWMGISVQLECPASGLPTGTRKRRQESQFADSRGNTRPSSAFRPYPDVRHRARAGQRTTYNEGSVNLVGGETEQAPISK